MTEKEQIISEINELLGRLDELCKGNAGAMFLHGDSEDGLANLVTKGDAEVLSEAFLQQMERNNKFNQLMTALFASHLVNSPIDKEMFLAGLEISKVTSGAN